MRGLGEGADEAFTQLDAIEFPLPHINGVGGLVRFGVRQGRFAQCAMLRLGACRMRVGMWGGGMMVTLARQGLLRDGARCGGVSVAIVGHGASSNDGSPPRVAAVHGAILDAWLPAWVPSGMLLECVVVVAGHHDVAWGGH
jgi:hypothetical protein